MTDLDSLGISIAALTAYNIELNVIKDMLKKLNNVRLELDNLKQASERKTIDRSAIEKLYEDLCKKADIYRNKEVNQEIYQERYIGINEACKWMRNLLERYKK